MGNGDLKERLAQQGSPVALAAGQTEAQIVERPKSRVDELRGMIDQMMPEIQKALPRMGLTPERLGRLMVTSIRTTPDLAACSNQSILGALMMSATMGLEPGPLGLCYILPFNNRRQVWNDETGRNEWVTVKEAEFVIGYKGELELARRSGEIKRIMAKVVFERDHFDITDGLHADLVHKRFLGEDRGKPIGAYMVAEYTNGGFHFDFLTRAEIERIRDTHSKGYRKGDGQPNPKSPWFSGDNFDQGEWQTMWCKTVIRQNFKWLPVSTELALMAAQDETVKRLDVTAKAEDIQMLLNNPDEAAPPLPEPQAAALPQQQMTAADITGMNDKADDSVVDILPDGEGGAHVIHAKGPQEAPEAPKAAKTGTGTKKKAKEAEQPPSEAQPRFFRCRECGYTGELAKDVTEEDVNLIDCGGCAGALIGCADFAAEPFPAKSVQSVIDVD